MKKINLSNIKDFFNLSLEEIINYCLDNKISTIINDFSPYKIEYDLSDLSVVIEEKKITIWDNLKNIQN